jgi:hypothetical protein
MRHEISPKCVRILPIEDEGCRRGVAIGTPVRPPCPRYGALVDVDHVVDEYLVLALCTDRLLPGNVAGYSGDPTVRRRTRAEPAPSASALVRAAGRLAAQLPDADLHPVRERFLAAQLAAVECTARRLVGQGVPIASEVALCFGVRIALGEEDAYRRAHREIDELLSGPGSLADRLAAHRRRDEVPPDRLLPALHALSEALRERTRARWPLPAGEAVEYRLVTGGPWAALHHHLGGHRSRVTVNATARLRCAQLPHLVAHESYPGHHTERCRKQAGLVTARGWHEHRVGLVRSPQSLVAEGAADLGLHAVVGPGWGPWAAEVLRGVGLPFDGELAERLDNAATGLQAVRQDAALLLHDRRGSAGDALAHLRRWLLIADVRARQVLESLAHPLWRGYVATHVEGPRLVRDWLQRPGAEPPLERYRRLLDEPLTPAVLHAEQPAQDRTVGGRTKYGRDGRRDRQWLNSDEW